MLTIVVPEGAGVYSTGHLRIIKVRDYKVAYGKRRHGVYESKINILMLPWPSVSIYSAYAYVTQYILMAYAVVL